MIKTTPNLFFVTRVFHNLFSGCELFKMGVVEGAVKRTGSIDNQC
jgi:hypothetical protein